MTKFKAIIPSFLIFSLIFITKVSKCNKNNKSSWLLSVCCVIIAQSRGYSSAGQSVCLTCIRSLVRSQLPPPYKNPLIYPKKWAKLRDFPYFCAILFPFWGYCSYFSFLKKWAKNLVLYQNVSKCNNKSGN